MNGKQLHDAIGDLPEELLAPTARLREKKRSFPAAWVSLAACLCLVIGLGVFWNGSRWDVKAENAAPEMEMPGEKGDGMLHDSVGSTVRIFRATVLEVHEAYLLVEPLEGEWERTSADRIEVSLEKVEAVPGLSPGDLVEISYGGTLLESYPARTVGVTHIHIIK